MSSTRIEALIDEVQAAFDRRPTDIEAGLDVGDAALLQLRKACRAPAGAEALRDASYYTLVIEASFVAIERTVEFRLLERGTMQPDDLPVPTLVSIGRLQQPVSSGSRWPRTSRISGATTAQRPTIRTALPPQGVPTRCTNSPLNFTHT